MKIDAHHFHRQNMGRLLYVGEYLEREGYNLNGTRFQRYLSIVNRFMENPELTDDEAWALVELSEMYVIVRISERHECIGRAEISICLKGAHSLENERLAGAGNKARNYCFQLYIASNLLAFGMKAEIPTHAAEADIRFIYDRSSIPVECKRLFVNGKVENIVKTACSQVSKRVMEEQFGIVAISLSREFWAVEKSAVMESVNDARFSVGKLYNQWRETFSRLLKRYPKVALIYINFQVPTVGPDNLYTTYERKFFKVRDNYKELPEAGVAQHFINGMMTLGLMEELKIND
ncbi:hypothetical protein [Pseudomonas oryzihabitans]|uniref:hypothetical protein n=1 Tax=Pseudomonas oryzihabitans TaxID=47885 RepID=UPI002895DBB7|nr:hypothetical protein [Pseudomonas oryzihabitans]MDT3722616.1 hypothetical protein [Pseudomonas oryzihabitans]